MFSAATAWILLNKKIILSSVIIPFVGFTISKFPDPRAYKGKWYYPYYYATFMIVTHYSAGDWTEWGGKLKVPFSQYPRLKDVPEPEVLTFVMPEFHPIRQSEEQTVRLVK
jgi:hypothetical protein